MQCSTSETSNEVFGKPFVSDTLKELMTPPRGKLKNIKDPDARERERLRREIPRMKLKDIEDPEVREYERNRRQAKYDKNHVQNQARRSNRNRSPNSCVPRHYKMTSNIKKPLDMDVLQDRDAIKRGLIRSIHKKSITREQDRKNFLRAHAILPEVFRLDENVKPLAVGIASDIRGVLCDRHDFSLREVSRLLARYARSNWYLKSLINGTPRIDITGKETASPLPEHVDAAVKMMSWKLARRAARRKMFPELYEQCYGSLPPR